MSYPRIQLVTEPEPDAEVLFDFSHDWSARTIVRPGLSIGIPSVDGDPDAIGVEYGLRVVTFTGSIVGPRFEALQALNRLSRLLLRTKPGYLAFQLDALTKPVWFDLLRPTPGELDFEKVFIEEPIDRWGIELNLPAEPFALGQRVMGEPVAMSGNPLPGGFQFTLPEVIGDAPAPLRLKVSPSASGSSSDGGTSWLMSSMPLKQGADWSPIVWNVGGSDGFTNGPDTATGTNIDYVGGNLRAVTFATNATLTERITGTVPAAVPIGTYKVLVRVGRSDLDSVFEFQFGQQMLAYFYDQPPVTMDRAASPSVGHITYVDLGEFTFPRSLPDVPADQFGATPAAPTISLKVGRVSGTGTCYIDAFVLVPVRLAQIGYDPATTLITELPVLGVAKSATWDGQRESIWAYNAFDRLHPAIFEPRGMFPVATPGADNVVTVMPHVGGRKPFFNDHNSDELTDSWTVEWSYHPHILYLDGSD